MSTCCGGVSQRSIEIRPCIVDHSGCAIRASWGLLGGHAVFPFATLSNTGKVQTQPRAGEPTRFDCDGKDCFDRSGCYAVVPY